MRKQIAMLIPGMAFDGHSLLTHSLGGSETAGLCLARELTRQGNQVMVFNNCPKPGAYDGVTYLPIDMFNSFVRTVPHDVCIVQRLPDVFTAPITAKLNVLWQHDLASARNAASFKGILWNVDKIMVVSEWMKNQYQEAYGGLPDELFYICRNGIDLDLFSKERVKREDRNYKQLVYTARPERGLDVLLEEVFPRVLEQVPDAELVVANYDNPTEQLAGFYQYCSQKIASFGDRARFAGHLNKKELYNLYEHAGVYVYPTPSKIMPEFREVSCITAMECMAAGLPFVSADIGALPETLGSYGGGYGYHSFLVTPNQSWTIERYVEHIVSLIKDGKTTYERISKGAWNFVREHNHYHWDSIAGDLNEVLERFIFNLNDSRERLIHEFCHRSNIMLAEKIIDDNLDLLVHEPVKQIDRWIEKDFGFIHNPKEVKEHYAKIGDTHTDCFEGAQHEARLQSLIEWLRAKPGIKTILDYGCGLGVYAITIANNFPDKTVIAVDVDEKTIQWAEGYKEKYSKYKNVHFAVSDEERFNLQLEEVDLVIAAEILEHTAKPWDVLNKLESVVQPGGYVYVTVPYGPWEAESYETYPYRCHVWEFETIDFFDMFQGKKEFSVSAKFSGVSSFGEALGHYHISYKLGEYGVKPIDVTRKINFQRPGQTLSVSIIAGPGIEETLLWCLNSVKSIANEIVIVDCGMSDLAKGLSYKVAAPWRQVKIVPGESPLNTGFDEQRNIGVDNCLMDWILWIDTDERLINPNEILKYLRQNQFNGYGIRQHHFTVDAGFKPDMPVRLFRNNNTLTFEGRIHEHPIIPGEQGPGEVIVLSDVHIAHVGYLNETTRRKRFERNYPLMLKDQRDYPNRMLQKHFIMRDHMLLNMYELQQNGGQMTHAIRQRCEEVVALYREHFLGKSTYVGVDSVQYYSEANKLLGKGFDVDLNFLANKDGVEHRVNGGMLRYASKEDMMLDFEKKVKEAVSGYENRYW